MAQSAWAETDPTNFGGVFRISNGAIVVALQAIYLNPDVVPTRKDVIPGIEATIPDGSTVNQIRDLISAAVRAKGLEYGYDVPTNRILLPAFQRGV